MKSLCAFLIFCYLLSCTDSKSVHKLTIINHGKFPVDSARISVTRDITMHFGSIAQGGSSTKEFTIEKERKGDGGFAIVIYRKGSSPIIAGAEYYSGTGDIKSSYTWTIDSSGALK